MLNYPSISRIVALAVLSLVATGLHGGFVLDLDQDNQPITWPDERAYAVDFGMFFQDENRAPGQPLACRPLEALSGAEQPQDPATPNANLYLIVSPPGDRNEGCLVEPWKVPGGILPPASPSEEIQIVVTPEQWIPSSETLAKGGKAPPDLAVWVNAGVVGESDSELKWDPLEATTNVPTPFYTSHIEGKKRLVIETPLVDTVDLQIAGYHLENKRWKGLKQATEVFGGLLDGSPGGYMGTLRTIQSKNKELGEALGNIDAVEGAKGESLLMTSPSALHVAVESSEGGSKLAKGRWLALKNGARFRGYGLRVTGLEGAGAPAVLQVARKPDGTEPTKDEREALGFDDYVIFDVDVQDEPTRLEDRQRIERERLYDLRRIEWERSMASELEYVPEGMRGLSKRNILDYIAKFVHFSPAAEHVSRWRSHLEAVRADQVEWSEENRVAPRNSKALLISVGSFASENVAPIPLDLDIPLMREVAEAFGITDVRELRDETATAGEIRNALRELSSGTGPDDLILVYFSGHSMPNELVAHDTDVIPGEGEPSNAVGVGEFIDGLGAIPSRRVLAVLDSSSHIELGSLPANVAVMQATTSSTTWAQMVPEGSLFTVGLHAAVSALQKAQDEPALSVREMFIATVASLEPLAPAGLEPQQVPRPGLVSSWTSQQRVRLLPPWQFFSSRILSRILSSVDNFDK